MPTLSHHEAWKPQGPAFITHCAHFIQVEHFTIIRSNLHLYNVPSFNTFFLTLSKQILWFFSLFSIFSGLKCTALTETKKLQAYPRRRSILPLVFNIVSLICSWSFKTQSDMTQETASHQSHYCVSNLDKMQFSAFGRGRGWRQITI